MDIGDTVPPLTMETNGGGTVTLPTGKPTVVYFYPKDDTPGCTNEAKDFTAAAEAFGALGIGVVGISPDSATKHDKFTAKHELGIPLAADTDQTAANAFGVWVEKSMYGRTYMGIDRSTFLIDADGKVRRAWRKVKVKGHVDAVLAEAREQFG